MNSRADFLFSSYREQLIEHQFVGALLQHLWIRGVHQVDVLRSEVDAAGYDLVMICFPLGLGSSRPRIILRGSSPAAPRPFGSIVASNNRPMFVRSSDLYRDR